MFRSFLIATMVALGSSMIAMSGANAGAYTAFDNVGHTGHYLTRIGEGTPVDALSPHNYISVVPADKVHTIFDDDGNEIEVIEAYRPDFVEQYGSRHDFYHQTSPPGQGDDRAYLWRTGHPSYVNDRGHLTGVTLNWGGYNGMINQHYNYTTRDRWYTMRGSDRTYSSSGQVRGALPRDWCGHGDC